MFKINLIKREKELAFIYIIKDENGCVKVGVSKNPENRVKQLQTGHPSKLTLIYKEEFYCTRNHLLKIEKLLHREISINFKRKNGEWFDVPDDKIEDIKTKVIFFRIRFEENETYFMFR